MPQGKVLWHTVHIRFKENANQAARDEIYALYQGLKEACGGSDAGIISFAVDWNLDLRKGVHLSQIAIFDDNDALQRFRAHPAHAALTDQLREVADWTVADFYMPINLP